ncbi:MAG: hypothetical protein Q4G30_08185 [Actinomycetaceae bacterium]|nr:hypothetical protein [Actinomycetaceae bacterium]
MDIVFTPRFQKDLKRLPRDHQGVFAKAFTEYIQPALQAAAQTATRVDWPPKLRAEQLVSSGGICALTWHFARTDERLTFYLELDGGEVVCVFRRIGTHDIYHAP